MRINLQDLAKNGEKAHVMVNISERLPSHLAEPTAISVYYQVTKEDDYYLLTLETASDLNVICQRCSEQVVLPYSNHTQLAICKSDARAESLSALYECLVSGNGVVELEDIIADELYLFSPQFHLDIRDCDKIIEQYMAGDK